MRDREYVDQVGLDGVNEGIGKATEKFATSTFAADSRRNLGIVKDQLDAPPQFQLEA